MSTIKLSKIPSVAPDKLDKEQIKQETLELNEKIINYQRVMHAQGKYSLLIIFQGMDAAGKDGAIRSVFK